MKDGGGVTGMFMHYSLVFFFAASALLIFIALWKKGRLDTDEEAKFQMMNDEDNP